MSIKDFNINLYKKRKRRIWFKRIRFLMIIWAVVFISFNIKNLLSNKDQQELTSVKAYQDAFTENTAKPSSPVNDRKAKADSRINEKPVADNTRVEPLKKKLMEYLNGNEGFYGIYYYNLVTGEEFGINHEDEFIAASTIKVPLNLFLNEKIKAGEIAINDTLTYTKEDYEKGTGVIQVAKFGRKYSIGELSSLSIEKSDNVATNMLLRRLGLSNVKNYMREVGGIAVDDANNTSCPKDMGLYLKEIYKLYTDKDTFGIKLMNSLLNTDFNDRLPAKLPKTVKVAHKIGTQVSAINDVGIIFAGKPYILSVMSSDVNEKTAPDVIANISRKVYDFEITGR